ncbi:E-selectin-like [Branchiostoma floridae x Branchiostoma japonicum]
MVNHQEAKKTNYVSNQTTNYQPLPTTTDVTTAATTPTPTTDVTTAPTTPVPTTEARPCPTLTAPTNGTLSPPGPHSYPTVVTFACDTGYVRNGYETTTCQADGSWSNLVPTCTPRPCPALTAPTNGALSPTGSYSYPNQVTVTCNSGYQLNGVSPVTCQTDGTWSNPVGTCARIQCPVLAAPTNGARTPPSGANFFQNTINFNCNSGYQLNGATAVTCQADGTWNNPVPTCTPRPCPPLTAPTNGALSPAGPYAYPNQVTVTCNSGYQLNGVSPVTCQPDGTWSNAVGTCEPRECPTLTALPNGTLSPPGPYSYPTVVTFSCDTGYVRNGAETTTCQDDGSWSNLVPTCAPNGALSPPGPHSYPTVVTFACARPCPTLTAPTNGALSPPGPYSYPTVVTFACDTGYVRNGAETTTCQADGSWSNPMPTCTQPGYGLL